MSNDNGVLASAEQMKEYTLAKAAEIKGYGRFVSTVTKLAQELFKGPVSVADFAAAVGDDLSVGKDVDKETKAERNRIRQRIRYGLQQADLLLEKKREVKVTSSGGKEAGENAADAAEGGKNHLKVKTTAVVADKFAAFTTLVDSFSREELTRAANAIAARLAALQAA